MSDVVKKQENLILFAISPSLMSIDNEEETIFKLYTSTIPHVQFATQFREA